MTGEREELAVCRWPDCNCYSPQGPKECRVEVRVSSPLAERWTYLDRVDALRSTTESDK